MAEGENVVVSGQSDCAVRVVPQQHADCHAACFSPRRLFQKLFSQKRDCNLKIVVSTPNMKRCRW